MKLHGIIPPVVTPMQANEDLDLPALRGLIDHLIAAGVHGIFVLGTNSEFYALDHREKEQVMTTAVDHVNRRVPVLAGTGAETTREVERLVRVAERAGVDGVAVITPYFVQPTQAEIVSHFRRVAEATSLPILLYNNPVPCGGVRLEPETVARLAEHKNIVGIKDSSGDLQNTNECLRLAPKGFSVFQGRDTILLPSLMCGAAGGVPASANLVPEVCVGLYEAFRRGDWTSAASQQPMLAILRSILALATQPAGLKTALDLVGRPVGPSRAPAATLSGERRERMRTLLHEAGLIGLSASE